MSASQKRDDAIKFLRDSLLTVNCVIVAIRLQC